jgi:hypothetical protein
MDSMKRIITAAFVTAAIGLAPASARVTASGQEGNSGVRDALAAARQSLADLTQLPAAAQLQGANREAIAKLISDFNTFATAQSDWRTKYKVVDESLDKLLADAANAPAAAPAPEPATPPAPGAEGAAPAGDGPLDPTIVDKLKQLRKNLDDFEAASGDPVLMVEKIEEILGSGSSVNLSADQVSRIKGYLNKIRAAATK